jgi:hypothetical protein
MDTQAKTVVLLKYEIITRNDWHPCETYPLEVRSKWAWRCAADAEHLAKGYPEAEECIRIAKAFRDGTCSRSELANAYYGKHGASNSADSTYYAAISAPFNHNDYVFATFYAAFYAAATRSVIDQDEKWKLYISWLIEELCEYEANQAIIS